MSSFQIWCLSMSAVWAESYNRSRLLVNSSEVYSNTLSNWAWLLWFLRQVILNATSRNIICIFKKILFTMIVRKKEKEKKKVWTVQIESLFSQVAPGICDFFLWNKMPNENVYDNYFYLRIYNKQKSHKKSTILLF